MKLSLLFQTVVGVLLLSSATVVLSMPARGAFEVGAELLYWQPCGYFLQVATVSQAASTTTFQRQLIAYPRLWFGFCIYANWYHCSGLGALYTSYTRFNDHDRARRVRPTNQSLFRPTLLLADAVYAKGVVTTSYDKLNARAAWRFCSWYDSSIEAFLGGRYIVLEVQRLQLATLSDNTSVKLSDLSRLKGGGIELGVCADHQLLCGFRLHTEVGATLLIGSRRESFQSLTLDSQGVRQTGETIRGPSSTAYIPGVEAKMGVNFTQQLPSRCANTFSITAELGFCLEYFFHALRAKRASGGASATYEYDVGFIGPYVSIKGLF